MEVSDRGRPRRITLSEISIILQMILMPPFSLMFLVTSDSYNCGLKLSICFCFFPKGVASHVGFTLAQWNDGKVDEPLSRATFTSENKPLSVNCEVRLSCSNPH